MDWKSLPPLPALRAFAAFAETGSLDKAGAALNVTHAAISQQLRVLEAHLELSLFDRSGRALVLTDAGQRLARAVTDGFQNMAQEVAELTGADQDRPLHVSTTPTFASIWLMPRLPEFRTQNPNIDLMIDPDIHVAVLAPGGVDVAIRYGTGNWPGLDAKLLLPAPISVVAAPSLLAGRTIKEPGDLTDLPWIEELGRSESTDWLERRGVYSGITRGRTRVPGNLLQDGLRDGQGVAVTPRPYVESDIKAGRLIELFCEDEEGGYFVVTRPGVHRPPLKTFLQWLMRHRAKT